MAGQTPSEQDAGATEPPAVAAVPESPGDLASSASPSAQGERVLFQESGSEELVNKIDDLDAAARTAEGVWPDLPPSLSALVRSTGLAALLSRAVLTAEEVMEWIRNPHDPAAVGNLAYAGIRYGAAGTVSETGVSAIVGGERSLVGAIGRQTSLEAPIGVLMSGGNVTQEQYDASIRDLGTAFQRGVLTSLPLVGPLMNKLVEP
jgi:hypothetical protein